MEQNQIQTRTKLAGRLKFVIIFFSLIAVIELVILFLFSLKGELGTSAADRFAIGPSSWIIILLISLPASLVIAGILVLLASILVWIYREMIVKK